VERSAVIVSMVHSFKKWTLCVVGRWITRGRRAAHRTGGMK
jgi:hypothetical protein